MNELTPRDADRLAKAIIDLDTDQFIATELRWIWIAFYRGAIGAMSGAADELEFYGGKA